MTDVLPAGEGRDTPTPPYPLVQLAAHHPVERFTCGRHPGAAEIDEYLKTSALLEQTAGLSAVWIALHTSQEDAAAQIAGYFTLSPLSIPISSSLLATLGLPGIPYRGVGGYLLGRLGVAANLQGRGFGAALVAAAIKKAGQVRGDIGGAFLAVDPKNDALVAWYEGLEFGFRRLDPAKRRLVLPLGPDQISDAI